MDSPTHIFPHNLPEYVVIDVDPTTVVNDLQDESYFHPYLYENSLIHSNAIDEIHWKIQMLFMIFSPDIYCGSHHLRQN
ncbi:hypothetical protein L1987_57307 [Smallanthus sonchifolius]|uniref:Uncharacterized protein n=1 Tax=Smallanthus sonchifolius TaxID=185202 RepID=A0ACB9DCM7_9ASTR|nr:hypothetical protein L1987_57307 [Smallanthus sonchifolius]